MGSFAAVEGDGVNLSNLPEERSHLIEVIL
jgi:hypothetical protein